MGVAGGGLVKDILSIPLETQRITPDCVASRGVEGVWDEAVARLRQIFDAQLQAHPTATLSLTIVRSFPEPSS